MKTRIYCITNDLHTAAAACLSGIAAAAAADAVATAAAASQSWGGILAIFTWNLRNHCDSRYTVQCVWKYFFQLSAQLDF